MRDYIETMAEKYETIMLDRAENLLHDWFGDVEYWSIRRSMRFAPDLVKIANEFRLNQLISDDEMDSTKMAKKWENHRVRKHCFKRYRILLSRFLEKNPSTQLQLHSVEIAEILSHPFFAKIS